MVIIWHAGEPRSICYLNKTGIDHISCIPVAKLVTAQVVIQAKASFEERLNSVASLGIKVYPTEDLKSRRIKCGLDIRGIQKTGEQDGFAKVVYGRPYRSRTCDTLIKSKKDDVPLDYSI